MTGNGLIFQKMALILKGVEAIKKDRRNTQGSGFNYRGIDDMYNELHSTFAEHGVFCTTNVVSRTQEERQSKSGGALFYTVCHVEFAFWAEDGSCVISKVIGEAMDSGDKGTNKAMAIAHKYALMQAFLIPTEEDKDPDGKSHEVEPKAQQQRSHPSQTVYKEGDGWPPQEVLPEDDVPYTASDAQKRTLMVWASKWQITDRNELAEISKRLLKGGAAMYELEAAIPRLIEKIRAEATGI